MDSGPETEVGKGRKQKQETGWLKLDSGILKVPRQPPIEMTTENVADFSLISPTNSSMTLGTTAPSTIPSEAT